MSRHQTAGKYGMFNVNAVNNYFETVKKTVYLDIAVTKQKRFTKKLKKI
jgi:hypothetical protein